MPFHAHEYACSRTVYSLISRCHPDPDPDPLPKTATMSISYESIPFEQRTHPKTICMLCVPTTLSQSRRIALQETDLPPPSPDSHVHQRCRWHALARSTVGQAQHARDARQAAKGVRYRFRRRIRSRQDRWFVPPLASNSSTARADEIRQLTRFLHTLLTPLADFNLQSSSALAETTVGSSSLDLMCANRCANARSHSLRVLPQPSRPSTTDSPRMVSPPTRTESLCPALRSLRRLERSDTSLWSTSSCTTSPTSTSLSSGTPCASPKCLHSF